MGRNDCKWRREDRLSPTAFSGCRTSLPLITPYHTTCLQLCLPLSATASLPYSDTALPLFSPYLPPTCRLIPITACPLCAPPRLPLPRYIPCHVTFLLICPISLPGMPATFLPILLPGWVAAYAVLRTADSIRLRLTTSTPTIRTPAW